MKNSFETFFEVAIWTPVCRLTGLEVVHFICLAQDKCNLDKNNYNIGK